MSETERFRTIAAWLGWVQQHGELLGPEQDEVMELANWCMGKADALERGDTPEVVTA